MCRTRRNTDRLGFRVPSSSSTFVRSRNRNRNQNQNRNLEPETRNPVALRAANHYERADPKASVYTRAPQTHTEEMQGRARLRASVSRRVVPSWRERLCYPLPLRR
jgi:hypothetical protein